MGETTDTSAKVATTRPGFFQRTSIYGFELFTALFGLVATLIVIDYGLFALFSYLRSLSGVSVYVGEPTIWVVAAMVVWLPVTVTFYLRSRNEQERHPLHRESALHKVLISIYYVTVLFGAIGLSFAAIYALIHLAVTPDESVTDVIVRVVIPACIAALLHAGMMFAYPRAARPSRTVFAALFSSLAFAVAAVLLILSAGYIRASQQDETTAADMNALQTSISSYAAEHTALPEKIDAAKDLSDETQTRLSRYSYTIDSTDRYTLCADFMTDTTSLSYGAETVPTKTGVDGTVSSDGYYSYVNFSSHTKGRVCFKLRAYMTIQPLSTDITTN